MKKLKTVLLVKLFPPNYLCQCICHLHKWNGKIDPQSQKGSNVHTTIMVFFNEICIFGDNQPSNTTWDSVKYYLRYL